MKPVESKKMVTWSLFATGIIVVINKVVREHAFPSPRIFIALAVVYVILGFAADFAPTVAGPLALLVFLAILLSEGGPALEGVARSVARNQQKKQLSLVKGGKRL